jgi:hypothetical protein
MKAAALTLAALYVIGVGVTFSLGLGIPVFFLTMPSWYVSTPAQNPTVPPVENPTDRRGDEPQIVAAS